MNSQHILEGHSDSPSLTTLPKSSQNTDQGAKLALFDRAFAFVVLTLFSPLMIALTLLIAFGGERPFFLQERVGYKGRTFRILKFRTIPKKGWKSAEEQAETSLLARAQLAIFKAVSAVLRKRGIDELPQFANILRGDMQVLGPRPLMREDFDALPARRLERCDVLPGITGLAQINGGQELDPESKLALDLYQIKNLSAGVSTKIVLRTIMRLLGFSSATAKIDMPDLDCALREMGLVDEDAMVKAEPRIFAEKRQIAVPGRLLPESVRAAQMVRLASSSTSFAGLSGDRRAKLSGASQTAH